MTSKLGNLYDKRKLFEIYRGCIVRLIADRVTSKDGTLPNGTDVDFFNNSPKKFCYGKIKLYCEKIKFKKFDREITMKFLHHTKNGVHIGSTIAFLSCSGIEVDMKKSSIIHNFSSECGGIYTFIIKTETGTSKFDMYYSLSGIIESIDVSIVSNGSTKKYESDGYCDIYRGFMFALDKIL